MAVQYNSKNNAWGGFIIDTYKAKKGIIEVSEEATKLFDKYKDKDLSNAMDQIMSHGTFDNFIEKNKLADETLISFLKDTEYSEKTLENYQLYLKNSANGLTLFQRAGKAAGSAIKTLGATLANMALVWVISEAVSMIYSLVTASNRLQESAAKFGDEFASASSDIDNYKSKIAELHETIDSSTASYEETYSAREELLKIQDEMIEKFGSEAKSIDKIKDAINGVDEAFDSLTNDEWDKVKNDFNSDTGESLGDKIAYLFSHDFGRSSNMDKMMEEMGSTKESFRFLLHFHLCTVAYTIH